MTLALIDSGFTLPCGLRLKNRLCKAAMTEGLADARGYASDDHIRLYDLWSRSGVGLMITGNVMVDRFHLERAGNVVIDGPQNDQQMEKLRQYAASAQQQETICFVQLSHTGRQCPKNVNPHPKSASDVKLEVPGGLYARPMPLTEPEIEALIGKFSLAAKACQEAGFKGVQIHSAHGYLLSQFLSPKVNKRRDRWGGSLENRARLLTEIIAEVRAVCGDDFGISVKLNSADFQKGGFDFEDSLSVIKILNSLTVDLLEISGGTYEQPKMVGLDGALEPMHDYKQESTKRREAYFLKYASAIQKAATMPVMITGGFRTRQVMESALENNETQMIGLGRPLVPFPHSTRELLAGTRDTLPSEQDFLPSSRILHLNSPITLLRLAAGLGIMGWYYDKIREMGAGQMPVLSQGLFKALINHFTKDNKLAKRYVKRLKQEND